MGETKSLTAWEFHVDTRFMDRLEPVCELNQKYRSRLLKKARLQYIRAGQYLDVSKESHWLIYILKGEANRFSSRETMRGNNEPVLLKNEPLFDDTKRNNILFIEDSLIVRFDRGLFKSMLQDMDIDNCNVAEIETDETEDIMFLSFLEALSKNDLNIPALPDVIIQIREAIQRDIGIKDFVRILENDPVLAAHVINYANSALYIGLKQTDSLQEAVSRIGLSLLEGVVTSHMINSLLKNIEGDLKKMAEQNYAHCLYVASICYLLAVRKSHLNPEKAMLIGLFHDIGVIPVLQHFNKKNMAASGHEIQLTVNRLHSVVSSMVLADWGFANEFIDAAEEGDVWERYGQKNADYTDLVIVAHWCYESIVMKNESVPRLQDIPAFRKLGMEYTTQQELHEFMMETQQEVESIQQALKA